MNPYTPSDKRNKRGQEDFKRSRDEKHMVSTHHLECGIGGTGPPFRNHAAREEKRNPS